MTFSDYLKSRFSSEQTGEISKIYKISLSTGCTCPNRDGTKGFGGCIFCSEGGSGEFGQTGNITQQLENGKKLIASKMGRSGIKKSTLKAPSNDVSNATLNCLSINSTKTAKYIAYFQSFSNTYITEKMPISALEEIFTKAISDGEVCALSVGTRCDCITDDVVKMLCRVKENAKKPVWVEMGLQTCHDTTLEKINSCFTIKEFEAAFKKLSDAGLEIILHLIFGLPGENEEMMEETVKYVAALNPPPDGIKLQNLQILKGTKLAEDFEKGLFSNENKMKIFTLEEWGKFLKKNLPLLPEKTIVHRFTGDGPKSLLIETKWSADKKKVMNYLKTVLEI